MELTFKIEIENCWECPFYSVQQPGFPIKPYGKCTYKEGFRLNNLPGSKIDKKCQAL